MNLKEGEEVMFIHPVGLEYPVFCYDGKSYKLSDRKIVSVNGNTVILREVYIPVEGRVKK